MVEVLRQQEEVLLQEDVLSVSQKEDELVVLFLESEYEQECLDFPYDAPSFDKDAALWAARLVHVAAHLVLFRKDDQEKLGSHIVSYPAQIKAGAMLSADLMLRFLPDLIVELEHIDMEDPLIPMLKQVLRSFPYSAMLYSFDDNEIDYSSLLGNKCLEQLSVNRIVANRKTEALKTEGLKSLLQANVGIYAAELLGNFEIENKKE